MAHKELNTMIIRELLVESAGGEGKLEVLSEIANGSFRNGEAAERSKVAAGTMTRTRQKAEARLDAIRTASLNLEDLLRQIKGEVQDLSRKTFERLRDIRLDSSGEYQRLWKEHKDLFKVLEQVQGICTDSPDDCERACEIHEKLYEELGKFELGEIDGVDPGEVRRLYSAALDQIDSIRTGWRELADLLVRLDYHDIRHINIDDLRRLTDDGLDLIGIARSKLKKVAELLGEERSCLHPVPAK
jgi:hypothetical protein